MKTTKTLLTLLAGLLLSAAAYAQVEVTVTGSTAFRAITIDRSASIFDAGYVAVTNNASTGLITYSGTVAAAVPSLGSTPVKVRLSFSGSASGMLSVKNLTPVSTADTPGVNVNKVPDLALSDVFPGSATPPIPDSAFERSVLGVIPFVWVINNALTGISNITREQAVLLMTASGSLGGVAGMPATYLGGGSTNPVYLTGRDSGSGTRISTEKDIGFVGAPLLWATNGAGTYVVTNGYSSGGLERAVIGGKPDAIGYLGRADLAAIAATATAISYDGVPYSEPAVASGSYAMWGYEHIVNRVGGLSANQGLIRDALIKAITDSAYQSTPIYTNSFVRLNQMQVERGTDGGTITSLNF
jgi:hypothetical protein